MRKGRESSEKEEAKGNDSVRKGERRIAAKELHFLQMYFSFL